MPEGDTLRRTADGLRPFIVGRRVVAASDTQGTVWLWDLADPRRPGAALAVPGGNVAAVAISPDGSRVLVRNDMMIGYNGVVRPDRDVSALDSIEPT